ncbi:MAG: hypothetical protein CME06_06140 [Gemmatimonadetes bacterium]|nr:hypothetical protein [Gemmatimonadota bacterium]
MHLTLHSLWPSPGVCDDIRFCGYQSATPHIGRLPSNAGQTDSLVWNWGMLWNDFVNYNDQHGVFKHVNDQITHFDLGAQFLVAGKHLFGVHQAIENPSVPVGAGAWPFNQMTAFDVTPVVRLWAASNDLNNGFFVQPYLPMRSYEIDTYFHSSLSQDSREGVKPFLAIYQRPSYDPPYQPPGERAVIYYEATNKAVRVYELERLPESRSTELLVVNGSGVDQCLRLYSNRESAQTPLLRSAVTGNSVGHANPVPNAEFVDLGAWEAQWTACPTSLDTDPEIWADETYQPITRWDINVPTAHGDLGSPFLILITDPPLPQ